MFSLALSATSMRATRSASPEDRRRRQRCSPRPARPARSSTLLAVIHAGDARGQWAAEEGDWTEAAEAERFAAAAADRIYRVQVARTEREASLAANGSAHRDAAIALLHAGLADEALVTLERGRAQLVSDALDGDRAKLGAVRADLSEAYTAAAARVLTAERLGGSTSSREAHAALDHVIAEIRTLPGYGNFLRPMDLERVAAVAHETPLVYVGSSTLGAAVVAVLPGGKVATCIIDGVDDYVVAEHYERLGAAQKSRDADARLWRDALDDAGRWLGAAVWPLVRSVLGTATRAVVVQTGLMTLLPLHIAWSDDDGTLSGRRYALDEVELSFAPNARSLDSCRRLAARTEAASILTVGAPEHTDMAPLTHGARESAAVRAAFAAGVSFPGSTATRCQVLRAIAQHGVLHFACHGRARRDEPLESALLLAGDDVLTVRDLLEQEFRAHGSPSSRRARHPRSAQSSSTRSSGCPPASCRRVSPE